MSLDISLVKHNETVVRMNWLRNPFGLCEWAEKNAAYVEFKIGKKDLWYVCNNWNYENSNKVNRTLFKKVVDKYWPIIKGLKRGYFFFGLPSYLQFIQPHLKEFSGEGIDGIRYDEHKNLVIPQEYFNKECFHLRDSSLERYKKWFLELVEFAELLQRDKQCEFYCSN